MSHFYPHRVLQFWFAGKTHKYLMIKVNNTDQQKLPPDFYRPRSLEKQGDNALGSDHPSVRPSARSILGARLCRV